MTLLEMARQLEGQPDKMAELMNAAGDEVERRIDEGDYTAEEDAPRDPLHQDYIDASRPEPTPAPALVLTPPPAPVDPSQPHKIDDVQAALAFILAGNAYFTIRSMKTGMRYTFRVNLAKNKNDNPRFRNVVTHFVSLLAGPDNTQDYVYMGIIRDREFKLTGKSRFIDSSQPVAAFKWFLGWLQRNSFPPQVELWHEGRCGRCGRKLTVPESIERGIGPECAGLMTR